MKQVEFDQDLMVVLSPTQWKAVAELARDLAQYQKGQSKKTFFSNDHHPTLARIFMALERFEDEGWVESRIRNNTKRREWCLTQQGKMIRAQQTSNAPDTGTEGLIPKPA